MVVSSPQHGENTAFLSVGGIHGQGLLLAIPLELQGKKHQPFSMTQPKNSGTHPKTTLGPCHSKRLIFILWNSKRYPLKCFCHKDRRQKNWGKTPSPYHAAEMKGPVIGCGRFISAIWWKYGLFLQVFLWWTLWLKPFVGYPFGISRHKSISRFLWHSQMKLAYFMPALIRSCRRVIYNYLKVLK